MQFEEMTRSSGNLRVSVTMGCCVRALSADVDGRPVREVQRLAAK